MVRARRVGRQAKPQPVQQASVRQDPSVEAYIRDIEARYGQYHLPLEELHRRITAAMGDQSLSDTVIKNQK